MADVTWAGARDQEGMRRSSVRRPKRSPAEAMKDAENAEFALVLPKYLHPWVGTPGSSQFRDEVRHYHTYAHPMSSFDILNKHG